MVVLVLGASGFLGKRIAADLDSCGHEVIRAARRAPHAAAAGRWVVVDFMSDASPADWTARLAGVDAVVNAIGILRETPGRTFERIHVRGPESLFRACAAGGVKVIQISALGADAGSPIEYFSSKGRADDDLLRTVARAVVIRPSLVFGLEGDSAKLFMRLAVLPIVPLPGRGDQRVQPVHVNDLVSVVQATLLSGAGEGVIPLVGPRAVTFGELLAILRRQLGLSPARTISIPWTVMKALACVASVRRGSLLSQDALAMLKQGSTADSRPTETLLGRPARPPEHFLAPICAESVLRSARLEWWLSWLRLAVALTWLVSGIVSLGIYPLEESYRLLERVGLTGLTASIALYGAALLDIALGAATVALRARRRLWELQAIIVLGYTAVISVALPELWLHPFGPVLKNLPLLVAIGMLRASEA